MHDKDKGQTVRLHLSFHHIALNWSTGFDKQYYWGPLYDGLSKIHVQQLHTDVNSTRWQHQSLTEGSQRETPKYVQKSEEALAGYADIVQALWKPGKPLEKVESIRLYELRAGFCICLSRRKQYNCTNRPRRHWDYGWEELLNVKVASQTKDWITTWSASRRYWSLKFVNVNEKPIRVNRARKYGKSRKWTSIVGVNSGENWFRPKVSRKPETVQGFRNYRISQRKINPGDPKEDHEVLKLWRQWLIEAKFESNDLRIRDFKSRIKESGVWADDWNQMILIRNRKMNHY